MTHDTTGDNGGAALDAASAPASEGHTYVVTITDAAGLLGVSVRTVQRRLDAGELEAVTMAGKRCVKLHEADLPDDLPAGALDGLTLDAGTVSGDTTGDSERDTGQGLSLARSTLARDTSHDRVPAHGAPQGAALAIIADVASRAAVEAVAQAWDVIEARRPAVNIADKLMLTLDECRALTGLSRATLRAAIEAGELKARQIGRAWRVKRADLEAWVKKL